MELHADLSQFKKTFPVPVELIYNNLFDSSELQIKALLFLLMKGGRVKSTELAEGLFVSEDDALEALNFWSEKGVRFSFEKEKPDLKIKKRGLSENLSREECSKLLSSDENAKTIARECSNAMGKELQFAEIETFISLNMFYGISLPVILTAIVYCKKIDKPYINYIKKVLLNWNDQGVETIEDAEKLITCLDEKHSAQRLVASALSLGRNLQSQKEKDFAEKWVLDFGFSREMISLSGEKTVDSIGRISFSYIDKILTNWKEAGVKTPKDAFELDKKWQNRKEQSSFSNQTKENNNCSFDLDDLEKLIGK